MQLQEGLEPWGARAPSGVQTTWGVDGYQVACVTHWEMTPYFTANLRSSFSDTIACVNSFMVRRLLSLIRAVEKVYATVDKSPEVLRHELLHIN